MSRPTTEPPRPEDDCPLPQPAGADEIASPLNLTNAQLAELADESKQAEYRRQFLLQVDRRRGCPACGE